MGLKNVTIIIGGRTTVNGGGATMCGAPQNKGREERKNNRIGIIYIINLSYFLRNNKRIIILISSFRVNFHYLILRMNPPTSTC
jgi:hypothetical protein